MAGIGFELRKLYGRGTLSGVVQASVSGTMIVAGPWLLSILSITVIYQLLGTAVQEASEAFIGVIIYSYAFSLILAGGFHYIFTRYIADRLYERQEHLASGVLIVFSLVTLGVTFLLAVLFAVFGLDPQVAYPSVFKTGAVLFFVSINLIWPAMLFISLLKWYGRILAVYAGGMVLAVVLAFGLSEWLGTGGALLGFASGHLITWLLLMVLSLRAYPPRFEQGLGTRIVRYFREYRLLFWCGFLFYAALWVDKMLFWFLFGEPIPNSLIWLYEKYDIVVYYANLSLIPGLVYFVTRTETDFYVALRKFLVSLGVSRYGEIQMRKQNLSRTLRDGLGGQSLFQGAMSLSILLLMLVTASYLFPSAGQLRFMVFSLTAAFMHLLFMSLLNFLFYVERYRSAFIASLVCFLVNAIIALITGLTETVLMVGASHAVACAVGSAVCGWSLVRTIRRLDRIILAKAAGL
jgi:polysaccharide biosynthesis protein PelG